MRRKRSPRRTNAPVLAHQGVQSVGTLGRALNAHTLPNSTTADDPPNWWAPLLTAIDARDAEELRRLNGTMYVRELHPGENWPGQHIDGARVYVTLDDDGTITRRMVLP